MTLNFWRRIRFWGILAAVLGFIGYILLPPEMFSGYARHKRRRASCQSNLKFIGLALRQYQQDWELPPRQWVKALVPYTKTEMVFRCPETSNVPKACDYFWNARFSGRQVIGIRLPTTLVLLGDGRPDAPFDSALTRFPEEWRHDESTPAWRHLGGANYAFADGHVKWLKAGQISDDLRMVTR